MTGKSRLENYTSKFKKVIEQTYLNMNIFKIRMSIKNIVESATKAMVFLSPLYIAYFLVEYFVFGKDLTSAFVGGCLVALGVLVWWVM